MAGAVFHKLIKKSSSLRSITSFNNLLLVQQPRLIEAKPSIPNSLNPSDKINSSQSCPLYFYPSFPFGYFLDPVSVNGVNQVEEEVDEDVQTIWADSVKKKRKKKMNKHKYRKLKKRLRRKT